MIVPVKEGAALAADILEAARQPGTCLWWLGQSGFLVQTGGDDENGTRRVLFDPYLSDSLTRKYAATDKPHDRMTRCPIAPWELPPVTLVTSTHNHTDHLDAATLQPILAADDPPYLVIGEANRQFVADRLGIPAAQPIGLEEGQPRTLAGIEIVALPSAHEAVDRDPEGRPIYLGFVVRLGGMTIYHSGDTVLWNGLVERLQDLSIDVALLPINGRRPERRVQGNLWGREAAELAQRAGIGTVVPCHYEMFEFNSESPDEFVATCRRVGQHHVVARCGERVPLSAGR